MIVLLRKNVVCIVQNYTIIFCYGKIKFMCYCCQYYFASDITNQIIV